MREDDHSSGSMLLSFLLGGIVGAGLALLLAPQSGSETVQKIRDFTEDLKDKSKDYMDQAKDRAHTFVDENKDYYDEKKSTLISAIDAGKEAYEKTKKKISKS